jgi:hypothetical protein
MLRFVEKTTPVKVPFRLPYIEEALEDLAELVTRRTYDGASERKSFLAIFNECADKIDDKEKAFILDIIQDWREVEHLFNEKTDDFMQSVAKSMKTGKIDAPSSKADKKAASSAYKNSSADVQKKLDMIRKAGQSKPKPRPATPPKPATPKPAAPKPKPATPAKPKQEDSIYGIPMLPGNTDGGTSWTPGKVNGRL